MNLTYSSLARDQMVMLKLGFLIRMPLTAAILVWRSITIAGLIKCTESSEQLTEMLNESISRMKAVANRAGSDIEYI